MKLEQQLAASGTETSQRLLDSYQRIKEMALGEWAPALKARGGSHAGFPHTRNVGREIEKLLFPMDRPEDKCPCLSDIEAYVLLAATQLHDIGRLVDERDKKDKKDSEKNETGADQGAKGHDFLSYESILGDGPRLGIVPDPHIIKCVADVCRYHDFDPSDELSDKHQEWGPCTEDTDILKEIEDATKKGELRSLVSSTEADSVGCCITCHLKRNGGLEVPFEYLSRLRLQSTTGEDEPSRLQKLERYIHAVAKGKAKKNCFKTLAGDYESGDYVALSITQRVCQRIEKKRRKLVALQDCLQVLGLDYRSWVIDLDGVLYDPSPTQTYEPGLDPIHIQSVCDAAITLGRQVFGRYRFSYDDIAAEARIGAPELARRILDRVARWKRDAASEGVECRILREPARWALQGGDPREVGREMRMVSSTSLEGVPDTVDIRDKLDALVTIERYGTVRVAALAAVLAVADEMDESYERAVPQYRRATEEELGADVFKLHFYRHLRQRTARHWA